jgi:type I restriction enzyme S subunit
MKAVLTSAKELYGAGHRLDASYHASEGVKALHCIHQWVNYAQPWSDLDAKALHDPPTAYRTRHSDSLVSVARIFNGPRFARTYVNDPDRGVPFLSSSDMLQADLSSVKRLSLKMTPAYLLDAIRIKVGWTLISCSGTIGNAVYVHSDMDGMTGSQHIMRVAPDPERILPGYVYAFLSSPLGYALVTQGTYGAVVQHIEPHHIADLPIPRLDPSLEQQIHELSEQAAGMRIEALALKRKALDLLSTTLRFNLDRFSVSSPLSIKRSDLNLRLEGAYHAARKTATDMFRSSNLDFVQIGTLLSDIFYLGKLHRVFVDDPKNGIPMLSISDVQYLRQLCWDGLNGCCMNTTNPNNLGENALQ